MCADRSAVEWVSEWVCPQSLHLPRHWPTESIENIQSLLCQLSAVMAMLSLESLGDFHSLQSPSRRSTPHPHRCSSSFEWHSLRQLLLERDVCDKPQVMNGARDWSRDQPLKPVSCSCLSSSSISQSSKSNILDRNVKPDKWPKLCYKVQPDDETTFGQHFTNPTM